MAKIALLTNMMEFLPGYSLTGIVKDQAEMLSKYGNEVHLFVNDKYHGEDFPKTVIMEKKIPFAHLIDYQSKKDITPEHQLIVKQTTEMLIKELADYDFVYTHDFIFIGWFLPYGLACIEASRKLPDVRWFHWIHSVPSGCKDWWEVKTFGPQHKLVYPNKIDSLRVAESYRGELSDVRVIPHIKDMRSWFDFDEETKEFIDEYPGGMQADVVQIYPASVDRLEAKRVREVILIFSNIKKMGLSVCLIIANQWATTTGHAQSVEQYEKIAQRNGLKVGEEVIFTSRWKKGKYNVGLPKNILRPLMQCANLFIFPTREESFGLVLPEAALSSGCLCVLNKSLTMQLEVSGFTTLYFDFGSFHQQCTHENEAGYFQDIAFIIKGRMLQNESIMCRTFMRQHYNYDYLYAKYYAAYMGESRTWA